MQNQTKNKPASTKPAAIVEKDANASNGTLAIAEATKSIIGGKRSDTLVNKAKYRASALAALVTFTYGDKVIELPVTINHLAAMVEGKGFVSFASLPKTLTYGNPTEAEFDFTKATGRIAGASDERRGKVRSRELTAEYIALAKADGAKQVDADAKKGMRFEYTSGEKRGKGFVVRGLEMGEDLSYLTYEITLTRKRKPNGK